MADKIEGVKHEARPESKGAAVTPDVGVKQEARPETTEAAATSDRDVGDTVRAYGSGLIQGVSDFEHGVLGLVRDTATDSIHITRDVVTEVVRGIGGVADVTIRTAGDLLVGVAQGVRDVAGTLFGRHVEPRS